MNRAINIAALFLALTMLVWLLSACGLGGSEIETTDTLGAPEDTTSPETQTEPEQGFTGDEYTLPLEDGYNQLTLYWSYNGTYENCDIWIWWGDVAGKGYVFHECAYGAKVVVNVPEGVEQVGFIVRKNCSDPGGSSWGNATKDYEQDRFAVITGKETVIYLKTGIADQFKSDDGGKTLEMIKDFSLAAMVDQNKIQYRVTPQVNITNPSQIKVTSISTMNRPAATGYVELEESLDLSKSYRMEIDGYGAQTVVPTKIFDSQYFADNYHYDGDDLGAVINGETTTFKVWAPTASEVKLNLYADGHTDSLIKSVSMTRGDKGVWSHTEACGHGTYYTYTVTTAVGTQTATDPYAKSAGVNGDRSMVLDLSLTDPEGWEVSALQNPISSYNEAIIWEVHVRDFSNKIGTSQYKGKYLAFTERGLVNEHGVPVGVDYLVQLGITHVHLLPVYGCRR